MNDWELPFWKSTAKTWEHLARTWEMLYRMAVHPMPVVVRPESPTGFWPSIGFILGLGAGVFIGVLAVLLYT